MSEPDPTAPSRLRAVRWPVLVARFGSIGCLLMVAGMTLALGAAVDRLRSDVGAARTRRATRVVGWVEFLGPAATKIAQMVGSRADLLSGPMREAVARLFDGGRPMSPRARDRQWGAALRRVPALSELRPTGRLLGSGSIACVYEAVTAQGMTYAVKLQRPRVAARMATDLRLLTLAMRVVEKMPGAGGARLGDLMAFMAKVMFGQIDFRRELAHLQALAQNLGDLDQVVVPRVHPELSDHGVLVMDYVDGLSRNSAAALDLPARGASASAALQAVGRMVFRDGFVHCDLHPGNLYVRADGSVVLLDAGYCVDVPDEIRAQLALFFRSLRAGDGTACGRIMWESALDDGCRHGREEFIAGIAGLVAKAFAADRFEMSEFGQGVFEAQNRHGVHPPADFAFPLISLMVVEGTLRSLWPGIEVPSAAPAW